MKLFLIRHGQTIANRDKIYSGQMDVPLTPEGRAQAQSIRPVLEKVKFDKVYSSDLSRAMDTQKLALPGYEGIQTPLLREYDTGYLQGRHYGDYPQELKEQFQATKNYSIFGGESTQEVCDRVAQYQRMLEQETLENVAAFAHNGILNCMLQNVLGVDFDKGAVRNNNCTIHVYEYDGQKWRLIALNYMAEV